MIAATLFGPNYFAPSHDESTIEVFDTLEDVIDILRVRYMGNGRGESPVKRLDGTEERVVFPAFHEGHGFRCHYFPGPETSDSGVQDALTSIHNGWVDYVCTLKNDDGELSVEVRFA